MNPLRLVGPDEQAAPVRIPPASLSADRVAHLEELAIRLVTLDEARNELFVALATTDYETAMRAARRLLACGLLMNDIANRMERVS